MALSRNFVDRQIAPAYAGTVAYAQDAMSGLDLAKQITDPAQFEKLKGDLVVRREKLKTEDLARPKPVPLTAATTRRSAQVPILDDLPNPPDFNRHAVTNTPVDQIWRFVNPVMLYGRHLGVKGSAARSLDTNPKALQETDAGKKALELKASIDDLKETLRHGVMKPRAVFQFFKVGSEGNSVHVFDAAGAPLLKYDFPRQELEGGVCLADFVAPLQAGKPRDNLCMFVTTAGDGIRELSEKYKAEGNFLKMHAVQALALETAEAYAEQLHSQIRSMWGFPDRTDLTMLERFRAEYPGKRYSFGYPACPHLEDQEKLFAALKPEEIGVRLTDGCMMEPEASVSAIVLHHPGAFYFSVA